MSNAQPPTEATEPERQDSWKVMLDYAKRRAEAFKFSSTRPQDGLTEAK